MAKLAVFGCLEKYLFTLFCFELRKAQKSHCGKGGMRKIFAFMKIFIVYSNFGLYLMDQRNSDRILKRPN